MSRATPWKPFIVCYKTEVSCITRGHHVYKEVWDAVKGEVLDTASDEREEAKEYDKHAVGFYKNDILVGHIPIEISSLCYHFINQDPGNKIKAKTTGKRHREIGLVVPAKFIFTTDNKRYSKVLENELEKQKTIFPIKINKNKNKNKNKIYKKKMIEGRSVYSKHYGIYNILWSNLYKISVKINFSLSRMCDHRKVSALPWV